MDFTNEMPFMENLSNGFPNNAGSLFPTSGQAPQNAPAFPQFPQDFAFSSATTQEIARQYYNDKPAMEGNGVRIYVDPEDQDLEPILLEEVVIENNRYFLDFEGLSVVLFTGRDGARILEQYSRTQVATNEIALFLEVDDSTNYFGSVMRLLAGSQIESIKGLPHEEITRFAQSKGVRISAKDMHDFLKDKIEGSRGGVMQFLMKCLSRVVRVSTIIFDGLADFFDKTIPDKLDFFRIADDGWNGNTPFFLPDKLIAFLESDPGKNGPKALSKITKPFFSIADDISATALECVDLLQKFLPRRIYRKIRKVIDSISDQIEGIKSYIKENEVILLEILSTSLKALNAMLCGFVNSIVDFIKGIFQIIGIIFTITSEGIKLADNLLFYTEYISEIIENFIGAIVNIDYPALFKAMLSAPARVYSSFKKFMDEGIAIDFDIVTISYYFGYIIGLIAQIIVEILLTGGTVTVAKVVEYLKAPFTAVGNAIKAVIKSAKSVFQRVLDFISFIVSKLKKPKQLIDDFLKFVDELLNGLRTEGATDDAVRKPVGGRGPKGFGSAIGKYSGRAFNPENAGGPILRLSWRNARITEEGIAVVRKHVARFGDVVANNKMLERLENILAGTIKTTDYDRRFYTHEMREYERYVAAGVEDGADTTYELWNDLHTATLEDYQLQELDKFGKLKLYHPDVKIEDF